MDQQKAWRWTPQHHFLFGVEALTSYHKRTQTYVLHTMDELTFRTAYVNGMWVVDNSAQGLWHTKHLLSDNT